MPVEGAAQRDEDLAQVPPDAPARNPDEGVGPQRNKVERRNLGCPHLHDLDDARHLAIRRLPYRPYLMQACFQAAGFPINRKT